MDDGKYVWIQIAPNRWRQYTKADLDARPKKYGQAPYVIGDTINPVEGPDGRMYDSRSSWEKSAKNNNCYTYTKKEMQEHLASAEKSRTEFRKQKEERIRQEAANIVNDYDLSNKL